MSLQMKLFKKGERADRTKWMSSVQARYIIWRILLWWFQVVFISDQLVSCWQDRQVMWVSYREGSVFTLHNPLGAWISSTKPQTACASVDSFVPFPSLAETVRRHFSWHYSSSRITKFYGKHSVSFQTLKYRQQGLIDRRTTTGTWLNYYNQSC